MKEREHIVRSYEEELADLASKIARMGGLAEQQLAQALDALLRRDLAEAERIIAEDEAIDNLEREIEEQAILMIAKRQPMALDLREIMAAIKISADLERVGDLAKNVAKRTLAIDGNQPKRVLHGLERMGWLTLQQLKDVLDSYSHRDADKALKVWRQDEDVDAMYNSLFRELLTYMMEDPRMIGLCTHLLFGAKNVERIGDHTTNIAETVYYLVHGEPIEDDRPKGDDTSIARIEIPKGTKKAKN